MINKLTTALAPPVKSFGPEMTTVSTAATAGTALARSGDQGCRGLRVTQRNGPRTS